MRLNHLQYVGIAYEAYQSAYYRGETVHYVQRAYVSHIRNCTVSCRVVHCNLVLLVLLLLRVGGAHFLFRAFVNSELGPPEVAQCMA